MVIVRQALAQRLAPGIGHWTDFPHWAAGAQPDSLAGPQACRDGQTLGGPYGWADFGWTLGWVDFGLTN